MDQGVVGHKHIHRHHFPIYNKGSGVCVQYEADDCHNGYGTGYGHMSALAPGIQVGSVVERGQVIGYIGSTGYSTGPHAHFEIIINGQYLNPADYITPDNGDSSSDIENITVVLN